MRAVTPVRVDTVVVSTQHSPERARRRTIREAVIKQVIEPVLPTDISHDKIKYHINPTGNFVVGGPHGDAGVTGRKIIVDTYGGRGRHGGGAFSGKDPTKVDRSAAYMARHVAKNVVAPPAWPTAARSSSPTPSASPSRSASTSTPRGPARSPTSRSPS